MYYLPEEKLYLVKAIVAWYRKACKNDNSKVLRHPEFGRWKNWDDDRLFCSIFFSIASRRGSKAARDYMEPIEKGYLNFELKVKDLLPLSFNERVSLIWEFGTGKNRLNKHLGTLFSKPGNIGKFKYNHEILIAKLFGAFEERGFIKFLHGIDKFEEERKKARLVEDVVQDGIKLKTSRDFLNDIGMTDTLVALDVNVLKEMRKVWGWKVPVSTPSDRPKYEEIEDGVRDIANRIDATVLEIDKAVYFAKMTGEY